MPRSSHRPRVLLVSIGAFCAFTALAPHVCHAQTPTLPLVQTSAVGNLATTDGLRLQISTESETGVFLERDTLRTQTPIEWTIRAWNTLPQTRKLRLSWRIVDASGKKIVDESEKTDFEPATEVRRRRFFEVPTLGAYRIEVEARGDRKGADDVARVQTSFAVVASPLVPDLSASPLSVPPFGVESTGAPTAGETATFRALGVPFMLSDTVANGTTWPRGLAVSNPRHAEWGRGESANAWSFLSGQKSGATPPSLRDEVLVTSDDDIVREVSASIKRNILVRLGGGTSSTRWPTASQNALARAACGAAWAQMTRLLQKATPEGRLFEPSPLLWGASFRLGGNRIVALWNDAGENQKSRLVTQLEGVRVLDLWGNEVARSDKKKLVVPLSSEPVYLLMSAPHSEVEKAWREARWEGTSPVQAQVLPFSRPIQTGTKNLPRIFVRVQNVTWQTFEGRVHIDVPRRWKVANDTLAVKLQPGESRLLLFGLAQAERKNDDVYDIEVEVIRGRSDWKMRQDVPVATIATDDEVLRIDGALDEWNNATWMNLDAKDDATQVRLALRTDNANFYIACQVREPALQVRDESSVEYSFWNGDSVQIALGVRNVNPSRDNFSHELGARDSDYGFLLSPWSVGEDGAPSGRVLRLWSPQFAFGDARDRVRWGGVVNGARCVLRRDDRTKLTTWEAAIPLSQVPELQPARHLQNNENVRLGWILHSEDGTNLEWAQAANSFPWLRNTGSFLPTETFFGGVPTYVSFSPIVTPLSTDDHADLHFDGSVWNTPKSSPTPAPSPRATPNATPKPTPRATPNPTPALRPSSTPPSPTPLPPQTIPSQPLPPLPPAPASSLPPLNPQQLPDLPPPPTN